MNVLLERIYFGILNEYQINKRLSKKKLQMLIELWIVNFSLFWAAWFWSTRSLLSISILLFTLYLLWSTEYYYSIAKRALLRCKAFTTLLEVEVLSNSNQFIQPHFIICTYINFFQCLNICWLTGVVFLMCVRIFFFVTTFRKALWPTQLLIP